MPDSTFVKQLLQALGTARRPSRGIPDPRTDVPSLFNTVEALKEAVETLQRNRNAPGESAVLVKDLEKIFQILEFLIADSFSKLEIGSGTGIKDVSIVNGELIVVLTNGTSLNAGSLSDLTQSNFFAVYGHSGPAFDVPKETWVSLPNDGAGPGSESYLPSTVPTLLSPVTGTLTLVNLELGDGLIIRPDYTVTPTVNNTLLKFRYTLGTGAAPEVLERTLGRLDSGSGMGYIQDLLADYIPVSSTAIQQNPVAMSIWLSENGTVDNHSVSVQVIKR